MDEGEGEGDEADNGTRKTMGALRSCSRDLFLARAYLAADLARTKERGARLAS